MGLFGLVEVRDILDKDQPFEAGRRELLDSDVRLRIVEVTTGTPKDKVIFVTFAELEEPMRCGIVVDRTFELVEWVFRIIRIEIIR